MRKEHLADAGDLLKRFIFELMLKNSRFKCAGVFICNDENWSSLAEENYKRVIGLPQAGLYHPHLRIKQQDISFDRQDKSRHHFVFIDPDTGISLTTKTRRHTTTEEIARLLKVVDMVVVYQHNRRRDLAQFLGMVASNISDLLNRKNVFARAFDGQTYGMTVFSLSNKACQDWCALFPSEFKDRLLEAISS